MATAKQIAANRANAQKSSGPTSTAGKARSSMNRLSWGFCSNTILVPGEDPREFEHLLADLTAQHQPVNVTEQILVEKMAQNKWLSDRAFRLQGEAFIAGMIHGEKLAIPKDLSLLIRYRTSAENAFHRAHNELVKAKKHRLNSEFGFEPQSFGQQVPDEPEPEAAKPPKQPQTASVTPISANPPVRARDIVFTEEEPAFDLCPEAIEFLKKVG